jgi:CDP-diacylglycerol--glycerol-3-phosphate 3-phosphatidyltransferase
MNEGSSTEPGRTDPGSEGTVTPGPSSWNLPNALTVVRLLMGPAFVVIAWIGFDRGSDAWETWAAVVFGAAAITDLVDGELARRTNQVTSFGKIVDPIADKALTGSALVILSWFDLLPWWVTIVIVTREVIVTVLRFSVIRHGVIAASRGGKLKTALQIIAITLYLLPLSSGADDVAVWIMGAAVIVTIATGFDYCLRALALRRSAEHARQETK